MTEVDDSKLSAAASGNAATERFELDKGSFEAVKDTPRERVDMLAREVLGAVHEAIRKHHVTYPEYNALKAWLIKLGHDGEWPLFLDVWVEHVLEEVTTAHRKGSKGTIEGPYYVPDAPELGPDATLPMRDDEKGARLVWNGTVSSLDGSPLAARIEVWHADDDGLYSQYAPGLPMWNLRGTVSTGADGKFRIKTIRPQPYMIPTDGACGQLIAAAGWHPWRPAHVHFKVSAAGHESITGQLYFPGDPHNADDVASAVKPELMLDPKQRPEGGYEVTYDFVLDRARG